MTDNNIDLNFQVNMNSDSEDKKQTNKIGKGPSSSPNKRINKEEISKSSQKIDFTNFLQHANHPIVVFFTLFFKITSGLIYLLLARAFGESMSFILIVVCSAFDFWFIKNISGRFLVGLRWWNEINDDGTEEWIYESESEVRESNIDSKIFWTSLYVTPIFWGVFLFFNIISLSLFWGMICFIAMILSGSNMFGYLKCSKEQSKKLTDYITERATEGISNLVLSATNSKV